MVGSQNEFKAQSGGLLYNFEQRRIFEPALGKRTVRFVVGGQFLPQNFKFETRKKTRGKLQKP